MIRKLTGLALLVSALSFGQFNKSAPWMSELETSKGVSVARQNPNYTFQEVNDAFNRYWLGKDQSVKGSGYKPFMRWQNYWQQMVKPTGYLPTPLEIWESYQKKDLSSKVPNPTSSWTSMGPVTPGVYSGQLPGTGRINAVAVDPNNADIWYAGAPAGGIWRSADAGATWTNLFDNFLQIGVSGIAIDPNDSNTIYITTGDDDAADSYSIGVFKSTDGGTTWLPTGFGPGQTTVNTLMNEIVIDPTNSNILWVGTNEGLYKSEDAGVTWDNKRQGPITDFKLKPGDPNTIYTVTNSAYYKSTDGNTFTIITDILPTSSGRRVLAVTPANPDLVYILTANTGAQGFSYQGFFKSTDSGETFTKSPNTTNIMESNQAWFDLALEASPTNENEVFMGCLNVWKSLNGGNTWSQLNQWFSNNSAYSHADIHTLKFFNDKLYCGSDGGLYVSDNKGLTFNDFTGNMTIGQIYRHSIARNNAGQVASGLQDNGGQILDNGEWNNYHGGDGMDNVIDPLNDNLVYGFIQFGQFLNISSNTGQSVGLLSAPQENGNTVQGNWITPLAISSEGTVYAGYDAVYRLDGNSWTKLAEVGQDAIEDLEVDPTNPMVIYAGEENFVYRSEDGGVTFSAFFVADPNSQISDIAINSTDGSAIYVITSTRVGRSLAEQLQAPRKVYKVPVNANGDAGLEVDLTLNLPSDQAFFAIAFQGRHSDNPVYLGTNLGVYRIDDTLTEWEEYFTNLPSVAISDLEISLDEEIITASTYGRGMWQSPIPVQVPADDVRLVSVSPETNKVLCGTVIPEITVENNGLNPITNIEVSYSLNGNTPEIFNASVNLASGETTAIQLPALNENSPSTNNLLVTTTIAGDAFADNNSLSETFFINATGNSDIVNTFESSTDELLTYNESGGNPVWERGIPQGTLLNQAASGTQVYGTNLDGDHPDATKGLLVTNCYDFTTILSPKLKFKMAYDLEINFDIVYVQYSLDAGDSWEVLGTVNSLPNWYTSDRTNVSSGPDDDCQNCPGAQWTGTNATLTEYVYDFVLNAANGETDLTAETNIIFRIVFHSDPAVVQEGVVIDDLVVEGTQNDTDDDNDGILDINDNCPLIANADQANNDGDAEGDVCDTDDDNDGITDSEDNCPFTANADQADIDNDGVGDVCDDDSDNDGIPNSADQCPGTPEGTTVDVSGCPTFTLPASNFRVQTQGTSCIDTATGSISIEAEEALNYTGILTGDGVDLSRSFTEAENFEDLAAGTYSLCITVDGQAGYELCYQLEIIEPEPLSVSSKVGSLNSSVTINLAGGKRYIITLNGKEYYTTEGQITLPLSRVENSLTVQTDLPCQGTFKEEIILGDGVLIYPNPVATGSLSVYLGKEKFTQAKVSLFTLSGVRIFSKDLPLNNNEVDFNVDALPNGIYLLNVKTISKLLTYKIVKR